MPGDGRLCQRCFDLGLSVNHFIVGRISENNSRRRHRYSMPRISDGGARNFQIRTGASHIFATVQELRSNAWCGFCKLALDAIVRHSNNDPPGSAKCSLTWEVDGRSERSGPDTGNIGTSNRTVNKTRRLKLSCSGASDGKAGQVYLVLAVPPSFPGQSKDSVLGPPQETHSLGRLFYDHTEKQTLMRKWLSSCCKEHESTCAATHGDMDDFSKLVQETYFGVIDVLDMRLTPLPMENSGDGESRPKRYVALSYVWGKSSTNHPYMTTESTVMTHVSPGGLAAAWPKLSKTIQDAILLVNRLGERYLWVDSLCIVQDNRRSWKNNAKAMHLIYGHAYFTICAADGDASCGLKAVGPMLRVLQPFSQASGNGDHCPEDDDTSPISMQYADGVRILVTRPLDAVIHDSAWSKRAWTFQEQILSRRCLIFAEGRVYFQCRFAKASEDIWTDNRGNGWSLNRINSHLQSATQLKSRPIWFYMNFIRQFTGRHLTFAKDILAAFEGIAWLLQQHMDQERFLFGLPPSHFDLALLWDPMQALRRRRKTKSHSTSNISCPINGKSVHVERALCSCENTDQSLEDAEFPSWSWCGWMEDDSSGFQVIYDEERLSGCMANISQWLERHTWIKWFVRDEKGHLRPLRDNVARTWRSDMHEEDRWRGYSASSGWRPVIEDARTYSSASPTREGSSTAHRQRGVSFAEDSTRGTGRSSQNRRSTQLSQGVQYRVGNGGYLRRGSLTHPAISDFDRRGRQSSLSRYYQALPDAPSNADEFDAIIPENPFGTIRDPEPLITGRQTRAADSLDHLPSLEHMAILQFHTAFKRLYVTMRDTSTTGSPGELCTCDIADDFGDWCGCVKVARSWIERWQNQRLSFIAISEARDFTLEECPIWTYYIPKEREESQWDLFYVLLLERDEERCVWERVALGKVFQGPFEDADWTEVKLG